MPGFCRDCLTDVADRPRCPACGSPRIARHAELDTLSIAHVDCDAFYATIEKRDDPSLNDKPLIIGGGKRGVVSTACYVARTFGVHSAMPMFKALKACPHATVLKPDMAKYVKVGRQVRAAMFELTPQVEPLSFDEAFMEFCAEIVVLTIPGWDKSGGVRREIEYFRAHGKPVRHIMPNQELAVPTLATSKGTKEKRHKQE